MKQKRSIFIFVLLISSIFIFSSIKYAYAAEFKEIKNADIGHYQPSGVSVMFEDVEINGTYAYVSDASLPGLRVISLADPSNPSLIASRTVTGENSYEIEIANDVAYLRVVENQDWNIKYIDISSPASPIYKGLLDLGYARGFDASETTLFVNNYTEIISFNFSNIDSPVELDRLNVTEFGESLTFIDNYLYVCTANTTTYQLKIVNATDPSNLNLLSSFYLGKYYAQSYFVEGNVLYTSGLNSTKTTLHRAHVKSFDISDKTNPSFLSDIFIDGINGVGIAIHDNTLFSGACAEGIVVVNITNLSSLQAIGFYDDYQDIYCGGSEHYAMYPKLYEDATLGNLLVFTSMGCGLNIISIDNLEFEQSISGIPGFDVFLLALTTTLGIFLVYKKLRKNLDSSESITKS
jgi:hypothetical protein